MFVSKYFYMHGAELVKLHEMYKINTISEKKKLKGKRVIVLSSSSSEDEIEERQWCIIRSSISIVTYQKFERVY